MNPATIRILFAIFLIAHAWIHIGLAQVPAPEPGKLRTPYLPSWWRNSVDQNWPVIRLGVPPQAARVLGWALWLLASVGFILAGAVLLFAPAQSGLWQGLTIAASSLSLVLLALFWHPWLPVGILIDLALLAAIILRVPLLRFGN